MTESTPAAGALGGGLSRRSFLGGVGVTATGLVVASPVFWQQAAKADVASAEQVHLTFGADPASEVVVSWVTPTAVSRPAVVLGTAHGGFGRTIEAETRTYTDANNGVETITQHARIDRPAPRHRLRVPRSSATARRQSPARSAPRPRAARRSASPASATSAAVTPPTPRRRSTPWRPPRRSSSSTRSCTWSTATCPTPTPTRRRSPRSGSSTSTTPSSRRRTGRGCRPSATTRTSPATARRATCPTRPASPCRRTTPGLRGQLVQLPGRLGAVRHAGQQRRLLPGRHRHLPGHRRQPDPDRLLRRRAVEVAGEDAARGVDRPLGRLDRRRHAPAGHVHVGRGRLRPGHPPELDAAVLQVRRRLRAGRPRPRLRAQLPGARHRLRHRPAAARRQHRPGQASTPTRASSTW